ncbi:winged helix-turn-helix transcriptional regulator [Nocardioides sp. W3-2-3]|uniref:ArsR/SmtB family transcription factor n=1 Tax=Nocardioides convexus TaxID=2712224 RepID=UPI002418AD03|nr:metalloregulator ArsR/SmtB family transcription factor [Nocardioides convexus]NHA01426.1 winged helix-turn-helix transcriptional regulator [Nocardioides convexus]
MEEQRILAALAEPTRFEIVRLLAAAPRTIGELVERTGAPQPQVTRHVQALEAVGVVRVHRLGRRRVVALDRSRLRGLADWLAAVAVADPADSALEQYERAIAVEEEQIAAGETEHTIESARGRSRLAGGDLAGVDRPRRRTTLVGTGALRGRRGCRRTLGRRPVGDHAAGGRRGAAPGCREGAGGRAAASPGGRACRRSERTGLRCSAPSRRCC